MPAFRGRKRYKQSGEARALISAASTRESAPASRRIQHGGGEGFSVCNQAGNLLRRVAKEEAGGAIKAVAPSAWRGRRV